MQIQALLSEANRCENSVALSTDGGIQIARNLELESCVRETIPPIYFLDLARPYCIWGQGMVQQFRICTIICVGHQIGTVVDWLQLI
tara:strand:- start:136 stop:396 length:261 start_codon:yes stop_codon:yes gene_type:complete